MKLDLTKGKITSTLLLFALPMILGDMLQQMYNVTDTLIVGQCIGTEALAAVGSASPLLNLLLVLFIGISVGAGIMVSQYFGAKLREELSRTIGCCITLTALASVLIMVCTPPLLRPMLKMLNTPDSIIDWCNSYLTIMMLGIAGMAYYNILSGILRGM